MTREEWESQKAESLDERRERIATAVLAGFAAGVLPGMIHRHHDTLAMNATQWADALIRELDRDV